MRAAKVKKACSTDSPVSAQVWMKQMLLSAHQVCTSAGETLPSRSFLLPSSRYLALGALLKAIQYQTSFMFSQEAGLVKSKTRTTPWQDLKQVATIDRNFSCPAVSQIHSFTSLSCRLIVLQRKSIVVIGSSLKVSLWRYLQKREVLPTPLSPTRIILYLGSSESSFYRFIIKITRTFRSFSAENLLRNRTAISPLIMQRFHNLQPLPSPHNSPPLPPNQPLGSFLVIDPYPLANPYPQKHSKVERKKQPKSLQPTPRNEEFAKPNGLLPQQRQDKVDQKVRDGQAIEAEVQAEKKMGLGSKKKRNKMKQFILETLLKAKAEGKCLVIHKGTAQPQAQTHAASPANLPKQSHQALPKKEASARIQLPKVLMQGNRQHMKPQTSSPIFPSIKSSKRLLSVARELAEKREKRERKKEEVKESTRQLDLSQIEIIQEKIEIEQEKEIQEEIFVGSMNY